MIIRRHLRFDRFLAGLTDRTAKTAILARIARMQLGSFGDHTSVGDGVSELRIHVGAGWRVYYTRIGLEVVLLLAGGSKRTRLHDIKEAKTLAKQLEP